MLECRLGDYIDLTPAERAAIVRLTEGEVRPRRGATLLHENDRTGELFVLTHGAMMSHVLLDDGSRQILRFLLPGDLVGMPGTIYRRSPEMITTLTECGGALRSRAAGYARRQTSAIGALLMALSQMERVVCTDRLAAIGHTPAKARVRRSCWNPRPVASTRRQHR